MGYARFKVAEGLLRDKLGLPEDAEIVDARGFLFDGTVEFMVRSPDLPEVPEGEVVPVVSPTFTEVRLTFDWGLPKQDPHH